MAGLEAPTHAFGLVDLALHAFSKIVGVDVDIDLIFVSRARSMRGDVNSPVCASILALHRINRSTLFGANELLCL